MLERLAASLNASARSMRRRFYVGLVLSFLVWMALGVAWLELGHRALLEHARHLEGAVSTWPTEER